MRLPWLRALLLTACFLHFARLFGAHLGHFNVCRDALRQSLQGFDRLHPRGLRVATYCSLSTPPLASRVAIRLSRIGVQIVAFEQLALFPRSALPPELSCTDSDHLIFAVALVNAHQHWHAENAVLAGELRSAFSFKLHLVDSQDIDFFVFLVETAFLELVKRMDVEFVFLFNVFDVLFYLEEVGCES